MVLVLIFTVEVKNELLKTKAIYVWSYNGSLLIVISPLCIFKLGVYWYYRQDTPQKIQTICLLLARQRV